MMTGKIIPGELQMIGQQETLDTVNTYCQIIDEIIFETRICLHVQYYIKSC